MVLCIKDRFLCGEMNKIHAWATLWNSEEAFLVSVCGGLHGWSLGYYAGYFLGIIPVVNTGFGDRILVCLKLGGTYVVYLGRSEGVRSGEDPGMIYVKRQGEMVN